MTWWWRQQQQANGTERMPLPDSPTSSDNALSDSKPPSNNPYDAAINRNNSSTTSRDEQAYEELKSLFSLLNPDATNAAISNVKQITKEQPKDFADSIYSSTMSCSNCFDQAFYCSSAVGQLNNIYRYGGLRSCSDLWAQWRFCMRTKAMSDQARKAEIREFNKQKAAKYKLGPSSEDIWDTRKELAENAFTKEF